MANNGKNKDQEVKEVFEVTINGKKQTIDMSPIEGFDYSNYGKISLSSRRPGALDLLMVMLRLDVEIPDLPDFHERNLIRIQMGNSDPEFRSSIYWALQSARLLIAADPNLSPSTEQNSD